MRANGSPRRSPALGRRGGASVSWSWGGRRLCYGGADSGQCGRANRRRIPEVRLVCSTEVFRIRKANFAGHFLDQELVSFEQPTRFAHSHAEYVATGADPEHLPEHLLQRGLRDACQFDDVAGGQRAFLVFVNESKDLGQPRQIYGVCGRRSAFEQHGWLYAKDGMALALDGRV